MALNSNTVWEVRPTNGADTNSGGYVWGTDWVSISSKTDLAVDASVNTNVSSSGYGFTSADVGRFIRITAGTGFTQGAYHITAVSSGVATLDRSPAATSTTGGSFTIYYGIDYSQQNSANSSGSNKSTTDAVANGTTTLTSATAAFTNDIVGNIIYLQGGSGSLAAGWYEVKTYTNATTIVLDRTVASGTGITMNIGGALKTLSKVAALYVTGGNKIYVKAEATITTSSAFAFSTSSTDGITTQLIGYTSVRGDNGQVTLQATGSLGATNGLITVTGNQFSVWNFIFDANSQATSNAFACNTDYITLYNCVLKNFTAAGARCDAFGGNISYCEVTGGTSAATAGIYTTGNEGFTIFNNYVHDNQCVGINCANFDGVVAFNILYNNSGSTSDNISIGASGGAVLFNTVDSSGRDGIRTSIDFPGLVLGNIISNAGNSTGTNAATAYGLDGTTLYPAHQQYDGNAYYNNKSGNRNQVDDEGTSSIFTLTQNGSAPYRSSKDVVLTASPYTNAPTDWSLNGTTGGGKACKATAVPTTWAALGSTAGLPSFGAVQPAAGAGATVSFAS